MSLNLAIPTELINIDSYFDYADTYLEQFIHMETTLSDEGFLGDILEGIKNVVKHLINKIGQFIQFIVDLIKRAFVFISGLFSPNLKTHNTATLPKGANPPDKNIIIEGDKEKAEKEAKAVLGSSVSSVELLDCYSTEVVVTRTQSHPKIKGCMNTSYNPYALLNAYKHADGHHMFNTKMQFSISSTDDGRIHVTDHSNFVQNTLFNLYKLKSAMELAENDPDGYYQIIPKDVMTVIPIFKDIEDRMTVIFKNTESNSRIINTYLVELSNILNEITNSDFKTNELKSLCEKFVGITRRLGCNWENKEEFESAAKDSVNLDTDNSDINKTRVFISSIIANLRIFLNYNSAVCECAATTLRVFIKAHKEIVSEANSYNLAYQEDQYFRKIYQIPNDILQCLHKVFDYSELCKNPDTAPQKWIRNGNKLPHNTHFNLTSVLVSTGDPLSSQEPNALSDMSAIGSTTIKIPMSSVLNDEHVLKKTVNYLAWKSTQSLTPRKLLEDMASMTTNHKFAMSFLHEAKHAYDDSNTKYGNTWDLDADKRVDGSAYDDYGRRKGEYSADKAAHDVHRFFTPIFKKIASYINSLLTVIHKDLKAANIE